MNGDGGVRAGAPIGCVVWCGVVMVMVAAVVEVAAMSATCAGISVA